MKLSTVAFLLSASMLAACEPSASAPRTPDSVLRIENAVTKDMETGCEYLENAFRSTSLTPRIAADGVTHKGCKDAIRKDTKP